MARPTSKKELIYLSNKNYQKLIDFVNSFPVKTQKLEFPTGTMNRNIRDVLTHLHHWHLLFLNWYEVGMKGEKPEMPSKGYTWKTSKELNLKIWKEYQTTELEKAKEILEVSYKKVQKIIPKHSNEELFEKKRYHWTGSTSLGSYLISSTSSHYEWAFKLIKKQITLLNIK